jgi:hypothetical protein
MKFDICIIWCPNVYTVISCIDMIYRYTWIQRYLFYLGFRYAWNIQGYVHAIDTWPWMPLCIVDIYTSSDCICFDTIHLVYTPTSISRIYTTIYHLPSMIYYDLFSRLIYLDTYRYLYVVCTNIYRDT